MIHTEKTSSTVSLSQVGQARSAVNKHNVSFDSHSRVWIVEGTSGIPLVITLYPKATCSCPSTANCYHITAVRMAMGDTAMLGEKKRNSFVNIKKEKSQQKRQEVREKEAKAWRYRWYIHKVLLNTHTIMMKFFSYSLRPVTLLLQWLSTNN